MKRKVNVEIVECPCYYICSGLGIETKEWCRYRKSAVPPAGMYHFNPKETWCVPGVQAIILMLGYMLTGEKAESQRTREVLEQVRQWAQGLRSEAVTIAPKGLAGTEKEEK
jgi:hypothetical protein